MFVQLARCDGGVNALILSIILAIVAVIRALFTFFFWQQPFFSSGELEPLGDLVSLGGHSFKASIKIN